jgi:gas vesicle protein
MKKEAHMSESNSMGMGGQLAAFALGAAVGAGIALLYAPYSGEETRQMLAKRGRAVKDRVSGAVEATKDVIREQWQQSPTV